MTICLIVTFGIGAFLANELRHIGAEFEERPLRTLRRPKVPSLPKLPRFVPWSASSPRLGCDPA